MTDVDRDKIERFARMVGMTPEHVDLIYMAVTMNEFAPDPPIDTTNDRHVRVDESGWVVFNLTAPSRYFVRLNHGEALRMAAWLVIKAEHAPGEFAKVLDAIHRPKGL